MVKQICICLFEAVRNSGPLVSALALHLGGNRFSRKDA